MPTTMENRRSRARGASPSSQQPGAGGLGDYDDIFMLTVRNEHEPFVGRMPRMCERPTHKR